MFRQNTFKSQQREVGFRVCDQLVQKSLADVREQGGVLGRLGELWLDDMREQGGVQGWWGVNILSP